MKMKGEGGQEGGRSYSVGVFCCALRRVITNGTQVLLALWVTWPQNLASRTPSTRGSMFTYPPASAAMNTASTGPPSTAFNFSRFQLSPGVPVAVVPGPQAQCAAAQGGHVHVRRVSAAAGHPGIHGAVLPNADHLGVLHLLLYRTGRLCRVSGASFVLWLSTLVYTLGLGNGNKRPTKTTLHQSVALKHDDGYLDDDRTNTAATTTTSATTTTTTR